MSFSLSPLTFTEPASGTMLVTAILTRTVVGAVEAVTVGVANGDSGAGAGTATGADFAGFNGISDIRTYTFQAADATVAITFTIVGDGVVEGPESFTIQVGGAQNGILGGLRNATLNDPAAPRPPLVVATPTDPAAPFGFGSTTYLQSSYVQPTGDVQTALTLLPATASDPFNLTGNAGNQIMTGNAGANILNGGGGSDTMIGLGGNDTFLVRGPGDVVIEANGGGVDTVFTTVSYSLGANEVEVLSTANNSGTDPINLTGNFATQTIIGNYGDNVLNGGSGGLDTLIGLFGNDVYAVGDSRVVIVENAGQGTDTVVTSVDYTLAAGVSVEVLAAQDRAGTSALALRGNEVAQTIIGNNGANILDGGLGNDTLAGGGGADSFRFTTALGPNNVDSVVDFESIDKIGLGSTIFGLTSVTAANFTIGSAATSADQRIVYNQATGQLFFDADGSGSGAAVQFAQFVPNTVLAATNFEVIGG